MVFEFVETFIVGVTAISLLALALVTLGGSVVGLAITTPLFVLFSPILIPAAITVTVLASGVTGGGSSLSTAIKLLIFIIKKMAGKQPGTPPSKPASTKKG